MTLKSRNHYTFFLASIFFAVTVLTGIFFIYSLIHQDISSRPQEYLFTLKGFSIFRSNPLSVAAGIFLLSLYLPVTAFYLFAHFEKTPSTEIIYFLFFLLGILPELSRLLIPLCTTPESFSSIATFTGRFLFWGRTICAVGFFLGAYMGEQNQRINVEQNIIITTTVTLFLATLLPVNTTSVTKTFSVKWGYASAIYIFQSLIIILALASYAIQYYKTEDKNQLKIALYLVLALAGKIIITASGIFTVITAGFFLLILGTFNYLELVHKMNM